MNVRHLSPRHRERAPQVRESGDPLLNLQRQMDRLFDGVMRQFDRPLFDRPLARFGFDRDSDWPNVELSERDKELVLTAELPGMGEHDVDVLHDGDALVLRGERRDVREDAGRRYSECYYGRFERRVPIDADVDWEQVKAEFRDGLLTVTLPKTPRAQAGGRRIPITRVAGDRRNEPPTS